MEGDGSMASPGHAKQAPVPRCRRCAGKRGEDASGDCDEYRVDRSAGTGRSPRWASLLGLMAEYGPGGRRDERLLTYTSGPLRGDLEVTGHPLVTLFVSSTASDGAFFVYLEDIGPDGEATYVTEGQLRAVHRRVSEEQPLYRLAVPPRTFARKDALPLVPGSWPSSCSTCCRPRTCSGRTTQSGSRSRAPTRTTSRPFRSTLRACGSPGCHPSHTTCRARASAAQPTKQRRRDAVAGRRPRAPAP